MAKRNKLPDIMGDALGRLRITEASHWPQGPGPDQSQEHEEQIRALRKLRLKGMARALERRDGSAPTTPAHLLDLMIREETREREQRRTRLRLRQAGLRYQPVFREVDFNLDRGLDRAYFLWLAKGEWLDTGDNLIITGPVGVGKTFLACVLARRFCLQGRSALYLRTPELWPKLGLEPGANQGRARGRRTRERFLRKLLKVDLLILDDWGLTGLEEPQKQELMSLLDERSGQRSTLIASPLGSPEWPGSGSSSTLDRSILDRLMHRAHFLSLKGRSVRQLYSLGTAPGGPAA